MDTTTRTERGGVVVAARARRTDEDVQALIDAWAALDAS